MDASIHLVLCDFGKLGHAFLETDPDHAGRADIVSDLMSGQIDSDVLSIVEMNPAEGWSRDVTEDVANELYDRCIRKGDVPSAAAAELMGRFHLRTGAAA